MRRPLRGKRQYLHVGSLRPVVLRRLRLSNSVPICTGLQPSPDLPSAFSSTTSSQPSFELPLRLFVSHTLASTYLLVPRANLTLTKTAWMISSIVASFGRESITCFPVSFVSISILRAQTTPFVRFSLQFPEAPPRSYAPSAGGNSSCLAPPRRWGRPSSSSRGSVRSWASSVRKRLGFIMMRLPPRLR
jgi:hypothetical protein